MRKRMEYALVPRALPGLWLGLPALLTSGCGSVDRDLRNTVVLHYQHVADVHRAELSQPVARPKRAPVHAVLPLGRLRVLGRVRAVRPGRHGRQHPELLFRRRPPIGSVGPSGSGIAAHCLP